LAIGDNVELGFYDGTNLAKSTGHIVVSMNYRVGVFGFFANFAVLAENPNNSSNVGMQDQRAAMNWTLHNIEAFGGASCGRTVLPQCVCRGCCSHHGCGCFSTR
jgi:carboxylesterase type B